MPLGDHFVPFYTTLKVLGIMNFLLEQLGFQGLRESLSQIYLPLNSPMSKGWLFSGVWTKLRHVEGRVYKHSCEALQHIKEAGRKSRLWASFPLGAVFGQWNSEKSENLKFNLDLHVVGDIIAFQLNLLHRNICTYFLRIQEGER